MRSTVSPQGYRPPAAGGPVRRTVSARGTRAGGRPSSWVTATLTVAALSLLLSACSTAYPSPLVRRAVAPPLTSDPAAPCVHQPAPGAAAPAAAGADAAAEPSTGVRATFDRGTNTIRVTGGKGVTLAALSRAIKAPAALRELSPGEWLLGTGLEIGPGAGVLIAAPDVRWLKLRSAPGPSVSVKVLGGGLDITGTCLTSWDVDQQHTDVEPADGRSYLLARDGGQMNIDRAELRYLGNSEVESYGLSWRTEGSGGGITHSVVSNNWFGMYSAQVGNLVVVDNEFHDNVLYGIDPHTGSHNLKIERNVVHDNGKHGIILAEDCVDSVIRDNIVYRNHHHGIVLYLRSNRNLVENNESFGNQAQGININESAENTVRANRVYDNVESGIGVTQTAEGNIVDANQIHANQQDGVRLVSESTRNTVRSNVIGDNARYGVYVDGGGTFTLAANTIFRSRIGVLLKGAAPLSEGDNDLYDNRDGDIRNS